MALRLREIDAETPWRFLCTPTGNELPEMLAHWERLEERLETPLTRITNRTLEWWINEFNALPNFRQRWCTRLLKIEPALAYLKAHQPAVLYVGLRADEEERKGIFSADAETRFPLREWDWGRPEVLRYLRERGVKIPARTDCQWCYHQRLGEWRNLLERHPDLYANAEQQEAETGHTFRSPGRDSHPVALADLRRSFERQPSLPMFVEPADEQQGVCRVCSL